MALVGLQYEPVKLDVNEVCFDEEQDISNTCEKSKKDQNVTGCTCRKWDVMQTNVKSLSCPKVEALGYFPLLDMRYYGRNMVTERASRIVLQLYLIWTTA